MLTLHLFSTVASTNAAEIPIQSFGVRTSSDLFAESFWGPSALLTLWFGDVIVECTILPWYTSTEYTCTTWTTKSTSRACSEYKMMIENNYWDAIGLDQVYVILSNNTFYGIESFCIYDVDNTRIGKDYKDTISDTICGWNTIYTDVLWVDNENYDRAPPKQIVYFDINKPNEYITKASWEDGTNMNLKSDECSNDTIINDEQKLLSFGVVTGSSYNIPTTGSFTVTLWFDHNVYQCTVYPTQPSTRYGCDISTWKNINISRNCTNDNKMMIEQENHEHLTIDKMYLSHL